MQFKSARRSSSIPSDRDGLFAAFPSRKVQARFDFGGQLAAAKGDQKVREAKPDPHLVRADVEELNEALKLAFEQEACREAQAQLFDVAPAERI